MKKLIVAAIAACALSAPALAGEFDEIVGAAMLDVDTVTVLDSERWAVQGGLGFSSIEVYGFDVGESTTLSLSAAAKIGNGWQIGLGYATDIDNMGDSYVVKGHVRYGFGGGELAALK